MNDTDVIKTPTDWDDVPQTANALILKYAEAVAAMHDASPDDIVIHDDAVGEIKVATAFAPAMKWFDWPGSLAGGPTPLTRTLTGAGLGAALGYGGGWLSSQLWPDKYLDKKKARRNMAVMGAVAGGLPTSYFFGRPAVEQHGMSGWLKKSDVLVEESRRFQKYASAFLPKIEVDDFNRVIWRQPALPGAVKAMTTGMVSAASAAHGGARLVSPFDVARIAVGMGSGAASAALVGKTLGALAGLTPESQDAIFRTGAGVGLLMNVVPQLMGR
jgi:hypothetical protein